MARPSDVATRLAIKIHKHVLESLEADTYIAALPIASMIDAEVGDVLAAKEAECERQRDHIRMLEDALILRQRSQGPRP